MANIKFPTDLDNMQPTDEAVVLAADEEGKSHNIRTSDLVEFVKNSVPLDELAATVQSQQGTISEQSGQIEALKESYTDMAERLADLEVTNSRLAANQAAPALEGEVAAGKRSVASAIRGKGIPATETDTLNVLAMKITNIRQTTEVIDGGELYAPLMFPVGMYNLFDVAADIKTRYLNTGLYAGALIAQYYKGYATLDLSQYSGGYAACETCDGYFYANDGEHTPIGVHTWDDEGSEYGDRWVAFLFAEGGYTFGSYLAGICPRELVVLGDCARITVNNNRMMNVWAVLGGTLGDFVTQTDGSAGNWAPMQVMPITHKQTGVTYLNIAGGLVSVTFPVLTTVSGGTLMSVGSNSNFSALVSVTFPVLTTVSGGTLMSGGGSSYSFSALVSVTFPMLTTVSGGTLMSTGGSNNFSALVSVTFPVLTTVSGGTLMSGYGSNNSFSALVSVTFPMLTTVSGGTLMSAGGNSFYALVSVTFPVLTTVSGGTIFRNLPHVLEATLPALRTIEDATGNSFLVYAEGATTVYMQDIYLPVLEELKYPRSQNRRCPICAKRVHAPSLVYGNITVRGTSSFDFASIVYMLAGCNGEPTQELCIYSASTTYAFELEIGDKESIDAGVTPRWEPRMRITLININVLTAESMALKILDRLADNTDGDTITITLGATNLNRLLADETYAPYVAAAQAKNYTIV